MRKRVFGHMRTAKAHKLAYPRSLIRTFTVHLESLDTTEYLNGEQRPG